MRRYIRELRPTSVYDLAAMVALYRPGPMDNIPAYIRRKHGQEPVTYLHPLLEPYLEKTYGIFVYQEDIMAAAIALGGFTGPEADTLGYAIRKKKSSVLRAQKEKFVTQAAERGVPPQTIDAVFKAFEPFERYGFNKAHATCYGLIAYQTAYLKANYTVEYMTSVLTAVRDTTEKVAAAIAECRRLGIEVRPPDVHRSGVEFTVEGDAIRFGLLAVKNVGQGAIESIIAARAGGRPVPVADRLLHADRPAAGEPARSSSRWPGSARSNAFGHPAQILARPRRRAGRRRRRPSATGSPARPRCSTWPRTPAALERPLPSAARGPAPRAAALGEGAPRAVPVRPPAGRDRRAPSAPFVTAYSGDLGDESLDQQRVVVGGIVTGRPDGRHEGAGDDGASSTLEDLQGAIEVVVFPRLYEETRPTWAEGAILLVAGRVDHKGEEVSLLADLAVDWDDAAAAGRRRSPGTSPRAIGRGGAGGRCRRRRQRRQRQRQRHGNGSGYAGGRPGAPVGSGGGGPTSGRRRTRAGPDPVRSRLSPAVGCRWPGRVGQSASGGGRGQPAPGVGAPRRAARGSSRPSRSPTDLEPADLGRLSAGRRRAAASRRGDAPGSPAPPARRHSRSRRPPDQVLHVRFTGGRRHRGRDGGVPPGHPGAPGRDPGRPPRPRRPGRRRAADGAPARASPTTPSCWPRSADGSARARSSCASPDRSRRAAAASQLLRPVSARIAWTTA